ncbi:hypothetical protein [Pseudarthrobacter sp. DSP2-3-2b1]|uniref:hypothetical protein n=1 Tax=Pseudarthrobacter sp. DSP2-3-2b1 TaxID=2804661 RepID=UPI003CF97467
MRDVEKPSQQSSYDFMNDSVATTGKIRRRSVWADVSPKDWRRLAIMLALLGALLTWELSDPQVGDFFQKHPLLGGVFTATLLSILTIGGFAALRSHWEAEKWRRLSALAVLSIAFDLTVMIDVFIWLVTGARPSDTVSPARRHHAELKAAIRTAGLQTLTEPDFGQLDYGTYEERLENLLRNEGWLRVALQEIDRYKAQHRRGIALWIPSMAFNPYAAAILDRVVAVNDFSSYVQKNLRARLSQIQETTTHEQLKQSWFDFLAESINLREELWTISRGRMSEWHVFRTLLPPDLREAMAQRDTLNITDILGQPFRRLPPTWTD